MVTLRWWPPVGLVAMVVLGIAVGKGATPVDGWFQWLGYRMGRYADDLLVFTYPPLVAVVLAVVIGVAVRRRQWRLVVATVLSPPLAILAVQVLKRLLGREKGGYLAYPSGHTTFLVVVLGLLVVVAGAAAWSVIVAVSLAALGMFGQAVTYHYFTDTIGAALLATSVVCLAALVASASPAHATPSSSSL